MTDTQRPTNNVSAGRETIGPSMYGRNLSLIVGDDNGNALDLSDLRVVFQTKRGDLSTPNSLSVRVYNMNPATMARVQKEFKRVRLLAGYESNCGLIFDGSLIQARFGRETATDTCLYLTCADGDRAYNFCTVSTTLAKGWTPADVIHVCAKEMEKYGVTLGYVPPLPEVRGPRGVTLFGMVKDILSEVAEQTNTYWSIQDGRLQFVPKDSYVPSQEIPIIDSKSGMVGMPAQLRNAIQVRTLMRPDIKISQLIQLDNKSIQQFEYGLSMEDQKQRGFIEIQNKLNGDVRGNGIYYCAIIEHQGDSRGTPWYTDISAVAVDATAGIEIRNKSAPGAVAPPPPAVKTNI